jgi:ketosteroid isomerase-like protein
MKKLFLLTALFLAACGQTTHNDSGDKNTNTSQKSDPKDLMETDKQFSKMSAEKGLKEASLFYAADEVMRLVNKELPVNGKDALKKMLEENMDPQAVMTWEPVKADIAASGDLGYTIGNWKMRVSDSTRAEASIYYGNYMSVWKKMADGSWKYVAFSSNSTPSPEEK